MYICNCNGIRAHQVQGAIEGGARTPRDVHARQGCQPQCGKCLPEIAAALKAHREAHREACAASCATGGFAHSA